jgi:hypothetical protein
MAGAASYNSGNVDRRTGMIDNFSIFFTTIITVYVIWRAARLDKKLPWFPAVTDDNGAKPPEPARDWRGRARREAPLPWRR